MRMVEKLPYRGTGRARAKQTHCIVQVTSVIEDLRKPIETPQGQTVTQRKFARYLAIRAQEANLERQHEQNKDWGTVNTRATQIH